MIHKISGCCDFNSNVNSSRPLMELIKGIYLTERGFIQIINNILLREGNKISKCICEKYVISSEDFKSHFKLINIIEKQVEEIIKNKSAQDDILLIVHSAKINSLHNIEKSFRDIKYKELYSFIREINKLVKISAKPKIFISQTLIFMELFTNIIYTICEIYELCKKNDKVKIIESNIQVTDLNHLKKGYIGIWAQLHRVISTQDKSKFIPVIHKDACQYSNLPSKLFHDLRKNMLDSLKQMCKVKVYLIKLKIKILEVYSSMEEIYTAGQLWESIPDFSEIMAEYSKCESQNVKSFEDILVAPEIHNTLRIVDACPDLKDTPVVNSDGTTKYIPEVVNQQIDHLQSDIVGNLTVNSECCSTNYSNFSQETKTFEIDTAIDYLCLFAFTNNNPDSFYISIPKDSDCFDTVENIHYAPYRMTNEMLCIETVNNDDKDDNNVKYLNETLVPKLYNLKESDETCKERLNRGDSQKITEIKMETKEAYTQKEEWAQFSAHKIDSSCQTDNSLEKTKKPKIQTGQSRIKKFIKKSCKRRKNTNSITKLECKESRKSIMKIVDNCSSKWPIEGNYIRKESRGERTVKFDINKESRIFKSFGKQTVFNKYSAECFDILEYRNTDKDFIIDSSWPLNKHQVKVCKANFNQLGSAKGQNNFQIFYQNKEQKNYTILPTIRNDNEIKASTIKNNNDELINSNVKEIKPEITNSIKEIQSSLNSNIKEIRRPSICKNVNETRTDNIHETLRPSINQNIPKIIQFPVSSSNTKEMIPSINNKFSEIMTSPVNSSGKEIIKDSSNKKEGVRQLLNENVNEINLPATENINSTEKIKTGHVSYSNMPKIRTGVTKPSTHLTAHNAGSRNKANNNLSHTNNKDVKSKILGEVYSVCENNKIKPITTPPTSLPTQLEIKEPEISKKETPFRLFDINGYPLTDIDGNILKDSSGNLLVHLDQHGKPLDRTEIFDAAGTSCYSIKYNPKKESLFKNIGIKLSDNRFKNPVQIYDKYGRPLTDSQGRLLANIHGKTLLIFDNFGIPSSDAYGGSVYKKPGVKWSYDLLFTENSHNEKQSKENNLFVTKYDDKSTSREINLNCKPGKSYVIYETLEDVKNEKSELKENNENNKTELSKTHDKCRAAGEHKLNKSLEVLNQENKKFVKNKLSMQKDNLNNSKRKRLSHHANDLFLPLMKGNISVQNKSIHFKENLNTDRNQADDYMDLLRSIVYVNIISDKTLALKRPNRSFKYNRPIFNEILSKTNNKYSTVIMRDPTAYPEVKFSKPISVIINTNNEKNKHSYFESGDTKDVHLPCVINKNKTDDIIKENCEAVHKNIKIFNNILNKNKISHRLTNVKNKLNFSVYESGINRVSLQQIHIPLCQKKSVKYVNININRAHREIILKKSQKDIKNTEQIVQIKYNNKNFLKHYEKQSKSGPSISYHKQSEQKDDKSVLSCEKKHNKKIENNKHLEKKRGKSKKHEEKSIKKRTRSKTVCKNLKKTLFKTNTQEKEIHNKKSVLSSIIDIPLKYLFNKLEGKVIDVHIDTHENSAEEKLKYRILAKDLKRTDKKTNIFESKKINSDEEKSFSVEKQSGEIKKAFSTMNWNGGNLQDQGNSHCHRESGKECENIQIKHEDKLKESGTQNVAYDHNLNDKQNSVGCMKTKNNIACIKSKTVLKQQKYPQYKINGEINGEHVQQNEVVHVNRYQSIHCSANKNKINVIYKHKSHSHCRNRMHSQNIRQMYECRPQLHLNNTACNNNTNMFCEGGTHLYHFNQPLNQSKLVRLKNEDLFLKWYDSNGQLINTYHHHNKLSPLLKYNRPAVSYRNALHEIYNTPHRLHYLPAHSRTDDHYHGDHCLKEFEK